MISSLPALGRRSMSTWSLSVALMMAETDDGRNAAETSATPGVARIHDYLHFLHLLAPTFASPCNHPECMSVSQSDVSSHAQCASVCPRPHGQHRNALSRPRVLIRVARPPQAARRVRDLARPSDTGHRQARCEGVYGSRIRGRLLGQPSVRTQGRPHSPAPLPRPPAQHNIVNKQRGSARAGKGLGGIDDG